MLLTAIAVQFACTHPIDIVGEGEIYSTNGFSCTPDVAPCDVEVVGAYEETYHYRPYRGYKFDAWEGCPGRTTGACSFNIPAHVVRDFWFQKSGPLTGRFIEDDRDGDGVSDILDIRPDDPQCTGMGTQTRQDCGFNALREQAYAYTLGAVPAGLEYFVLSDSQEVLRYNAINQQFLPPIRPDNRHEGRLEGVAYSDALGGVVWQGSEGRVFFVADNAEHTRPEVLFTLPDGINSGSASYGASITIPTDQYLIISNYSGERRLFTLQGEQLDLVNDGPALAFGVLWSQSDNTLYSLSSTSNNVLDDIILRKRTVSEEGQFSEPIDASISPEFGRNFQVSLSPDGSQILVLGTVFDTATMNELYSLPTPMVRVRWIDGNQLVGFTGGPFAAYNDSSLVRLNSSGEVVESKRLAGSVGASIETNAGLDVFVIASYEDSFFQYVPNDDVDGDGIANTEDAFPDDPAAAIDTDQDGYPDAWLAGQSADDSTSGLILDSFPDDVVCYLPEHSTAGSCDYARLIAAADSPVLALDSDGIAYLLDPDRSLLHRWSSDTNTYMPSRLLQQGSPLLPVNEASTMVLDHANNQLIIGFSDGAIMSLDTVSANPQLQPFAFYFGATTSMAVADQHLLVWTQSSQDLLSLNLANGSEVDRKRVAVASSRNVVAWDASERRVFLYSPGDTHFDSLDENGFFSDDDWTELYSLRWAGRSPIRFANNGHTYDGSGQLYSAANYEFETRIDTVQTVGQWRTNTLFTAANNEVESSSLISEWANGYSIPNYAEMLDFNVEQLAEHGGRLVAYGTNETGIRLQALGGSDADSDGLPAWWEQAHNLDDNNAADAVLDPDNDSLNNTEEYAVNSNPTLSDTDGDGLSDGDEVNTYLTDPAEADTDRDGASDSDEINSLNTDPLNRDSDGDRIADGWEAANGFDPNDASDATSDADGDGFSAREEYTLLLNPAVADSPIVQPWSRYGGNNGNSRFVPVKLNSANFAFRWEQQEFITNVSPEALMANGEIVRATFQFYPMGLSPNRIEVLSASTGSVIQEHVLDDKRGRIGSLVLHDGKAIMHHSDFDENRNPDNKLITRDTNGNISMVDVESSFLPNPEWDILPIGDDIYMFSQSSKEEIRAVSAQTGLEYWNVQSNLSSFLRSAMDGNSLYQAVYDTDRGYQLLKRDRFASDVQASNSIPPVQTNDDGGRSIVLSAVGHLYVLRQGMLRAYYAADMQLLWQRALPNAETLAVGGGSVFVPIDDTLMALDEFNGDTLWEWQGPQNSTWKTSLVATLSHVFISNRSETFAIAIATGTEAWSYNEAGSLSLSEQTLFIRASSQLTAIDVGG